MVWIPVRLSWPRRGSYGAEPRISENVRGVIAIVCALGVLTLTHLQHGGAIRVSPGEAMVMVLASLVLALRWTIALVVTAFACVALEFLVGGSDEALLNPGAILGLVAVAFVALVGAGRRQALGLGTMRAESVLGNLRGQLRVQGTVPPVPAGWHVDVEQRAAHGAAIAGDFICSRVHDIGGEAHLDLAVVDVSGKGIEAGTRALLLSGAMGGLLGAVTPDEFLAEANRYLREQSWSEGFASAVYVRVNLDTGQYSVRSAGHLPALHLHSQSRRWRVSTSKGMLLGIRPSVAVRPDDQELRKGDALLLYTDGVVEDPSQDLSWGTERLTQAAGAIMAAGPTDRIAQQLVAQVPTRLDDDRALVVIWRDAG
jgi:Stage II sporulation protein E (SpoIIE)